MRLKIMDVIVIAMFSAIVFTLEQVLSGIPNVQITVLLFILYARVLGFRKTMLIVIIHTLADNLIMGSLNPFTLMPMLIAWSLIPILLSTLFRKAKSPWALGLFAFGFGFLYGWVFIPFSLYMWNLKFIPYLIADLPFELLMGLSGALSVLYLYQPLYNFLSKQPYFKLPSSYALDNLKTL